MNEHKPEGETLREYLNRKLAAKGDEWNRKLEIQAKMRFLKDYAQPVEIEARFNLIVRGSSA